jgi:ABC-2 type transport system permease protein
VISLVAGLTTWTGAATAGVDISPARLLEAGANCVPAGVFFLGVAALAFALAPRRSSGIAYGIVIVAFVWQLVGSLLGVPGWLVDLTPFRHVGLVPVQPFRAAAAVTLVALGGVAMVAALVGFGKRDLMSA